MAIKLLAFIVSAVLLASCGSSRPASHDPTTTRDGHTRTVSVRWRLVSAHRRELSLGWLGGACLTPAGVRVVQGRKYVKTVVLARLYVPGPGEACPAYGLFLPETRSPSRTAREKEVGTRSHRISGPYRAAGRRLIASLS
jgi:hypothetical protein